MASIGVDSWAVDYGLLRGGRLLGEPFHYRDARNEAAVDAVHARVPFEELYRRNGLQFLPFNTVYQLAAEQATGWLDLADSLLLIPDLIGFQLTGAKVAERTNASTTGLVAVDRASGTTSSSSGSASRHPSSRPSSRRATGSAACGPTSRPTSAPAGIEVVAVGSHDTASAVVAVPMRAESAAYISCGTWGSSASSSSTR